MTQVLVLGAGYAGIMTALRLDRAAAVTVVDGRERFVQRIRLHQVAAGQTVRQPKLADLLRRPNIRFVQGWAREIDLAQRQVAVDTASGTQMLGYDVLIYALGSASAVGATPGAADYAYTLSASGPRSAAALNSALPDIAARGGTLAVVGGGLTGIEAATELAEAHPGLHVRLVAQSTVGPNLSLKGRQYIQQVFAKRGIELMTQATVNRVEVDALVLAGGQRLPVDATLWTASFAVPVLARESGLPVDALGRVLVGTDLRVHDQPNVFAVGDAAAVVEASGVPIRMACATAMPIGVHAGDNVNALLHGKPLKPFSFRYPLQCISLGRHEAMVQMVDGYDRPQERIITGRLGALVKESICRFTLAALHWERRWPGLYVWMGQRARPQASPTSERVYQHG